jgi:hypothetical protein
MMTKPMVLAAAGIVLAIAGACGDGEEEVLTQLCNVTSDTAMVVGADSAMVVPTDRSGRCLLLQFPGPNLKSSDVIKVVLTRGP